MDMTRERIGLPFVQEIYMYCNLFILVAAVVCTVLGGIFGFEPLSETIDSGSFSK